MKPKKYLLLGDMNARIVEFARTINQNIPHYVVHKVLQLLNGKPLGKVLILGVSYRSNVKEAAYSGVFDLAQEFLINEVDVVVYDPLYTSEEISDLGLIAFDGDYDAISGIVIHTLHAAYKQLEFRLFSNCRFVYDGRNVIPSKGIGYSPFLRLKFGDGFKANAE